jgi:hypothetical protein
VGTRVGNDGDALAARKEATVQFTREVALVLRRVWRPRFWRKSLQQQPKHTYKMPHSVTPESTPAGESSREMSQADDIKPEPETQDATMEDAPSPAAPAEKSKVDLEDMFDDDNESDGEFASSAPVKSEEESSQPAPVYVTIVIY